MATLSTVSRKKLLLSIDLECFDFIGALRSATQYISRSTSAVTAQLAPEVLDYLDLSTLKLESGSLPSIVPRHSGVLCTRTRQLVLLMHGWVRDWRESPIGLFELGIFLLGIAFDR